MGSGLAIKHILSSAFPYCHCQSGERRSRGVPKVFTLPQSLPSREGSKKRPSLGFLIRFAPSTEGRNPCPECNEGSLDFSVASLLRNDIRPRAPRNDIFQASTGFPPPQGQRLDSGFRRSDGLNYFLRVYQGLTISVAIDARRAPFFTRRSMCFLCL